MSQAKNPEVRAVLDTSAMVSYAREHVHTGELIVEIAEDGALVGLPSVSLLQAYRHAGPDRTQRALLDMLTVLPGTLVISLDAAQAAAVSMTAPLVKDDLARAHAAWAAQEFAAYFVTGEPHLAPSSLTHDQILEIPTDE